MSRDAPERPVRRRMPAAARRRLILEQAREAFLEVGEPSAVSLRMVAARGGIDEALIYRHFGSKEQLYLEAVVEPAKAVIAEFAADVRAAALQGGPSDRVRREWRLTYAFLVRLLSLPSETVRALGMLLFGSPPQARTLYEETLAPALRTLEDLVETELPNWEHVPFVPSIAVRMTLASGFWLVAEHDIAGRKLDVDAAARELTDRLIYGMVARA